MVENSEINERLDDCQVIKLIKATCVKGKDNEFYTIQKFYTLDGKYIFTLSNKK
jgi:hypothetical protein